MSGDKRVYRSDRGAVLAEIGTNFAIVLSGNRAKGSNFGVVLN